MEQLTRFVSTTFTAPDRALGPQFAPPPPFMAPLALPLFRPPARPALFSPGRESERERSGSTSEPDVASVGTDEDEDSGQGLFCRAILHAKSQ